MVNVHVRILSSEMAAPAGCSPQSQSSHGLMPFNQAGLGSVFKSVLKFWKFGFEIVQDVLHYTQHISHKRNLEAVLEPCT